MANMIVRMTDEKHKRLKELAKQMKERGRLFQQFAENLLKFPDWIGFIGAK